MTRVAFRIVPVMALVLLLAGCSEAPTVVVPPRPATRPTPSAVYEHRERAGGEFAAFKAVYARRGRPSVLVLANREMEDPNPAARPVKLRAAERRVETSKAQPHHAADAARSAEVSVHAKSPDQILVDHLKVERFVSDPLRRAGVVLVDLDTQQAAAWRKLAADSTAKPSRMAAFGKLRDQADILVSLRYARRWQKVEVSLKVIDLRSARILSHTTDTVTLAGKETRHTDGRLRNCLAHCATRALRQTAMVWSEPRQ